MVAESRQNLEDFCRERGLPIAAAPSAQDTVLGLDAVAPEGAPGAAETPTGVRTPETGVNQKALPAASQPLPPTPLRSRRQLAWVAIGAIGLAAIVVGVNRPWSSRDTSTAEPTAPHAAEPALTASAMPAPIEQAPPPQVVPQSDDPIVATDTPPASAPSSGAISLATAQLCQAFSTTGGQWRCDPPSDPAAPGPIVLYTRVRSPRDTAVVHRWYREDILRQTVTLPIRASASEGYRTYSRQTVDSVGNWRVEVRSPDGDLLHEQRFAVR